jgi:hypothetical protein
MADERRLANTTSAIYLNYADFINNLRVKDSLSIASGKLQKLFIENQSAIYQAPLAAGGDLPQGGIYFEHLERVIGLTNLTELRLINLFVKTLPENFTNLNKLQTLEICFSSNADVETIVKVLEVMPSLKYLDINGSRLAQKQRVYIREQLTKHGITVDDYVMLK